MKKLGICLTPRNEGNDQTKPWYFYFFRLKKNPALPKGDSCIYYLLLLPNYNLLHPKLNKNPLMMWKPGAQCYRSIAHNTFLIPATITGFMGLVYSTLRDLSCKKKPWELWLGLGAGGWRVCVFCYFYWGWHMETYKFS